MPENYYWYYDNFFQKVTNMESPRKNNDCYFYYYSTCTKGDSCTFRHEPSALGCETVCSFWKEGKCLNVHCSFRHMELRKNRKAIPCYWETQPGGCLKPHCPFLHKNPKDGAPENIGSSELQPSELSKALGQSSSQGNDSDRKASQYNETNFGNPTVDPLVVNFEEESDNESAPTNSPAKPNQTRVKVKTLEEIRLEKIQAESAAYYSYPGVEEVIPQSTLELESADDLRQRIMKRLNLRTEETPQTFEVLSLDEIRKRRKRNMDFDSNSGSDEDKKVKTSAKKQRFVQSNKNSEDLSGIKIKTLAEIRAERMLKPSGEDLGTNENKRKHVDEMEIPTTCSEVSSTSNVEEPEKSDESDKPYEPKPAKRLRRKVSSSSDQFTGRTLKLKRTKLSQDVVESTSPEKSSDVPDCHVKDENTNIGRSDEVNVDVSVVDKEPVTELEENGAESKNEELVEQNNCDKNNVEAIELRRESSKLDDILLLDDEDIEDSSINLKAEEDILKDIDDLLND